MGTIFVILLLLVLCGFIAYVGDLLGRRFGKKRLSIFGLRPKHTAILLTVATGVLIAAVTFSVALVSVPGFLRVVTQGERLVTHNRRLTSENRTLEQENRRRQGENEQLDAQNRELQSTAAALKATNLRLSGENRKLGRQNKLYEATNRRLQGENKSLVGDNRQLKGQNRALAASNKSLQGRNRALAGRNAGLARSNRELVAAKEGLARSVAGLRTEAQNYRRVVRDYKEAAYVFRRDEEIIRQVVPPDPSVKDLRDAVELLLFGAEDVARQRTGLKRSTNSHLLQLVKHSQIPAGVRENEAQLKDWVITRASQVRRTAIVLRVVADENCVLGRPVRARLEWYLNEPVFRKDEAIAETQLAVLPTTAARPHMRVLGGILTDLRAFLQSEVGPAATRPNLMIPSPEGLGEFTYEELLPVCQRIYELGQGGGRVRVIARARQDTQRAGPLYVWLDVEEARQASGRR